jgi:dienelactone hydrolase
LIGMACALALLTAGCSAHATEAGPQITVEPDGVNIAIPVRVTVDGLPAGDVVRVWARTYDRRGQTWESAGEFVTDGVGRVDVTTAASTGGTYLGVDPHGLFWSMRLPEPALAPYPLVDADDMVVQLGVDRAGETVARTTLRRVVREPAGRVLPIAEAGLVGDLYLPPGAGEWPGVLLLGGAEGGRPDPAYAALLAAQGYVVLALAYFGVPGLPKTLTRIPIEYGLAGARWLADRPEVAGDQIGLVGMSKGAEYALLLASTEPSRFAAVVAHVPSDLVWPAAGDPAGVPVSSWTRDGKDLPFLRWASTRGASSAIPAAEAYKRAVAVATRRQLAAARIPVELISAPILLTSGGSDGTWPSTAQAQRTLAALTKAGNPHRSQHLDFPGAGHFVGGVPDLPTTRTRILAGPITIEAGGDPAATAAAVRSTFSATVELLRKAMPRGPG